MLGEKKKRKHWQQQNENLQVKKLSLIVQKNLKSLEKQEQKYLKFQVRKKELSLSLG